MLLLQVRADGDVRLAGYRSQYPSQFANAANLEKDI